MTRMLARDIGSGDVQAAQNDYAMVHRYLERIKPVSRLDGVLDKRMDADIDREKALDPTLSGFPRIEHDLFASSSTNGLSVTADRLHDDAAQLQKTIATQAMAPETLVDGAVATLETISDRTLTAGSEPYSHTELWDIEANLDGTREIVSAIGPRIAMRDPLLMAQIASAFDEADKRLARYKEGCGFKSFDALTSVDKASLRDATMALTRQLSKLKAVPAID